MKTRFLPLGLQHQYDLALFSESPLKLLPILFKKCPNDDVLTFEVHRGSDHLCSPCTELQEGTERLEFGEYERFCEWSKGSGFSAAVRSEACR